MHLGEQRHLHKKYRNRALQLFKINILIYLFI